MAMIISINLKYSYIFEQGAFFPNRRTYPAYSEKAGFPAFSTLSPGIYASASDSSFASFLALWILIAFLVIPLITR